MTTEAPVNSGSDRIGMFRKSRFTLARPELNYNQQCAKKILEALPRDIPERDLATRWEGRPYSLWDLMDEFKRNLPCTLLSWGRTYFTDLETLRKDGRRAPLARIFAKAAKSQGGGPLGLFVRQPGAPSKDPESNLVLHNLAIRTALGHDTAPALYICRGRGVKHPFVAEPRYTFCQLVAEYWRHIAGYVPFEDLWVFDIDVHGHGHYDIRDAEPGPERVEAARQALRDMGRQPDRAKVLRDMPGEQLVAMVQRINREHECYTPPTPAEVHEQRLVSIGMYAWRRAVGKAKWEEEGE